MINRSRAIPPISPGRVSWLSDVQIFVRTAEDGI